jgi:hypothetical protein
LLVACYTEIRSFSRDLNSSFRLLSASWCNDLHSLRPSPRGVLVAATGVDAAAEFDGDGRELWRWWAVEHGFPTDRRGEPWSLGTGTDHRRYVYPIELQSIHVNTLATLDASTYLATLLHGDALIAIDRESGAHSVVAGVRQPHAVRVLDDDGLITYADTTAGEGVLARVADGRLDELGRVGTDTGWLQDAYFDGENWMLVDGANARVVHTDGAGAVRRVDHFDPDWCLYEVLPWPARQEGTDAWR